MNTASRSCLAFAGAAVLAFAPSFSAFCSDSKQIGGSDKHTMEKAYFAAGCFWKVQFVFSKVPGVIRTRVGYTGGTTKDPTYKDVCSDRTGHAETVMVEYDPAKVSYHKLLEIFWSSHDPTTANRQGPDVGTQYRSVIFYTTPEQHQQAIAYREELNKSHRFAAPIVTDIREAGAFYDAEDYHQDYFLKHGAVCH